VTLSFYVYVDETGIQKGESAAAYCMVAGWIGSPEQWQSFNAAWRNVLEREAVPTFHAKDFFQRTGWQSRRSVYNGWSRDRTVTYLGDLLDIIDAHELFPVGGAVAIKDFEALTEQERRFVTGGADTFSMSEQGLVVDQVTSGAPTKPYFAAFGLLIEEALSHSDPDSKIHFVFDRQDQYQSLATGTFNKIIDERLMSGSDRLASITFQSSRGEDREGLQAADLYCYAVNARLTKGEDLPDDLGYAFDRLAEKRPQMRVQNAASFRRMIHDVNMDLARWFYQQLGPRFPL
jgi:hypothetical protein